ncbi:MAG: hypothetical protein IT167_06590 [Bryobacterales bacterium]|nr:hypothetical protein [Bryobacterales bacterium]MCZ2149613.1 hypothetical protein [Bryobacterales bacterium]
MSYGVFVRLQAVSTDTRITELIPWGDFPKPEAKTIRGMPKARVTNRCHIIGWDLYARSYAARFTQKSILEVGQTLGYSGPSEVRPLLDFVEEKIREHYRLMNNDLTLYYNGCASENSSAGALYRAAREQCDSIYDQWEAWARQDKTVPQDDKLTHLAATIEDQQWKMFVNGFDRPPDHLFSREEIEAYYLQYVQIYHGFITGREPDLYYRYFYGIDTADFLGKAKIKLGI